MKMMMGNSDSPVNEQNNQMQTKNKETRLEEYDIRQMTEFPKDNAFVSPLDFFLLETVNTERTGSRFTFASKPCFLIYSIDPH